MEVLVVFLLWAAALTIGNMALGILWDILNFYPIFDYIDNVLNDLAWWVWSDAVNIFRLVIQLILIIYLGRWILSWLSPSWDTADD